MYCKKCGAQVSETAQFCAKCGDKRSGTLAVQSSYAAAEILNPDAEQEQWFCFARSVYDDLFKHGTYTGVPAQTTIAPVFARNEARIAKAPFELYIFTGIGDGSTNFSQNAAAIYTVSNPVAGLAYLAGSLYAKKKADDAAKPQWHLYAQGECIITDYGLIIIRSDGITNISWESIVSLEITAWNSIEMHCTVQNDVTREALVSPAALVIFVCWCHSVYPNHPQLPQLLNI
jgi:hypothetical protein